MTSRLRRRSRHRLHKKRNKVRGWRRRKGYDDRSYEWPTLLEAAERQIRLGANVDIVATILANQSSPIEYLDDIVWVAAPAGHSDDDPPDYDWPEDNT